MKYEVKFTTQFAKDVKLAKKQHRNIDKLMEVVHKLAEGEVLDIQYRDHSLSGNYKDCRECHIENDWLLVYQYYNDTLVLLLYRVGTHSELFKK